MWRIQLLFVFGMVWWPSGTAQWTCVSDGECGDVAGALCREGACACGAGQQVALAGTACVPVSPYHTSECVEDHQCSRLFMAFHCRGVNGTHAGTCACQTGHHYFSGRCWRSAGFGESCSRDEECNDLPRNPYGMQCLQNTCRCAEGYYERQRAECRKIGYGVGDGCVLDEDCQFENGACDIVTFSCVSTTGAVLSSSPRLASPARVQSPARVHSTAGGGGAQRAGHGAACGAGAQRAGHGAACGAGAQRAGHGAACGAGAQRAGHGAACGAGAQRAGHGAACGAGAPCAAPLDCWQGTCVCPAGYYATEDGAGAQCYAELGSQSSVEQCVGLLAQVTNGVCACAPNFFYEESMRDCVRVTRRISDSCVTDENCWTFGAASYCGEPHGWGLRNCTCDTERAVWDNNRNMCRLFAGIGEQCEVDSDCLAGELEVQCESGRCACPYPLVAEGGLCLTTGLAIGDSCQATSECTETLNTECIAGSCTCRTGYQQVDDYCAPIIGGGCSADAECVIPDTVCAEWNSTCQCREGFVPYGELCWPVSAGYMSACNVSAQCVTSLGASGACREAACRCDVTHHHRDGQCQPITHLFATCTRSSQCYLGSVSDRVVCRNSICQCDFSFPYNEELRFCGNIPLSSGSMAAGSMAVMFTTLIYSFISYRDI